MPNITFEDFRALAKRDGLKQNERIDDPFDLRASKTEAIVADIFGKLPPLIERERIIVDIGPGCGPIAHALLAHCGRQAHRFWLIDSPEMLAQLPDAPETIKVAGKFPDIFDELGLLIGEANAVLAYSVLHYVFEHDNIWEFFDRALALLAPGGRLLLGDVPSWSKRKRKAATQGGSFPALERRIDPKWPGGLTDGVIFGLMARATESGFDAYLLPQPSDLPMAERRVDLLFERPS
jgi:SAM-dependent methyltransferase